MEQEHRTNPFTQYCLKKYHGLLYSLPTNNDQSRVQALTEGALRRKELKLYKGYKAFIEDLQTILDHDRDLAPLILKEHKVMTNKDGSIVLNQCIDCGKYMPPFKYCPKCENAHFCSQACEMRSKLSHKSICTPRQQPSIDAALQVQIHIGGDLGRQVQVYFQHQLRMSLKLRGEEFIKSLFDFFMGEGNSKLPKDCYPQIINNHLKMRVAGQSAYIASSGKAFMPQTIDSICEVYANNAVLGGIVEQILKKGGILTNLVKEVHNNHLHVIYIFLCS